MRCVAVALAMSAGCSAGPLVDETAGALQATDDAPGDLAGHLAERAAIAASGRYAAPRGLVGPLAATPWSDALDIPGASVVAATVTGPGEASGIVDSLGVIKPIRGDSFVLLSTGVAGGVGPEPGTDFEPIGPEGDVVTLALDLSVPAAANRMSLQYNFLSTESPDFIGTQFNDTFSIQLIDASGTRSFVLASVNSSAFFEVSNSRAASSNFDIYTADPSGVDTVFGSTGQPDEPLPLPDAGLTDFQSFHIDVQTGDLRVLFTIADNGDGILDSAILIDAVQFSAIETLDPNPGLVAAGGTVTTSVEDLATGGRPVRGAVADGVTDVLLRVKVPGPGDVTFSVPGAGEDGRVAAIGSADFQTSVSTPTTTTTGGEYAFAVYRAPADFNRGGDELLIERAVQIGASYATAAGPGFDTDVEFQIRRPPVVLAQGLWSKTLDWLKMPITSDSTLAITYTDRSYSCDEEVRVFIPTNNLLLCPLAPAGPGEGVPLCRADGGTTIDQAAKEALANMERLGIAATQVDLVTHGAGGVHARQFINSAGYRNPANLEQGDVNRLITINTPHFGSPVADAMVAARENPNGTPRDEFLCRARLLASSPVDPGDLDDMIATAGGLATTLVPGHAVIGTGGRALSTRNSTRKLFNVNGLYSMVEQKQFAPAKILTQTPTPSAAFGTLDHDLFVDVVSQQGGLADSATTSFAVRNELPVGTGDDYVDTDYFHSQRSPAVSAAVRELLDSPVGGDRFGQFAATPPGFAAARSETSRAEVSLLPPDAALRIVSPVNGAEVVAGGTVAVQVVAESFAPDSVSAMTSGSLATSDQAPFTIELGIPSDALGPIRLLAIGFDADDEVVVSDDVVLVARTNALLQSVSIVTQNPILFGIGTRRQLAVVGNYDDGVKRDVTSSLVGTRYRTSNASVVAVTGDGTLIANGSGIATVVAQNGAAQDSITVTVNGNTLPLAVAAGDVSLTCVTPGTNVPVELDGSASFDPDGDPLDFTWFLAGVGVASGPTPTIELGPGVHSIVLQVTDGLGSSQATVTVTIEEDTPPALTIVGENPRTIECGSSDADPGATALDACDGDLTDSIVTRTDVNTREPGTYSVDYRVSDQAGLTSTATRAVIVADRTPPEVTVDPIHELFPSSLLYRRFDLSDCACATDTCGGDLDIDDLGEIVAIHSDEPDVVDPSDPGADILILRASAFKLRQQRSAAGNGRVYEVEFAVRDRAGNRGAVQSCFFGIRTARQSPKPINDGRVFTVRP